MLTPPPSLPPAVPPFDPDIDHAARELGRALLYVAQLSTLLNARAAEANDLDDQLQAARLRIQELERALQAERASLADQWDAYCAANGLERLSEGGA